MITSYSKLLYELYSMNVLICINLKYIITGLQHFPVLSNVNLVSYIFNSHSSPYVYLFKDVVHIYLMGHIKKDIDHNYFMDFIHCIVSL